MRQLILAALTLPPGDGLTDFVVRTEQSNCFLHAMLAVTSSAIGAPQTVALSGRGVQ